MITITNKACGTWMLGMSCLLLSGCTPQKPSAVPSIETLTKQYPGYTHTFILPINHFNPKARVSAALALPKDAVIKSQLNDREVFIYLPSCTSFLVLTKNIGKGLTPKDFKKVLSTPNNLVHFGERNDNFGNYQVYELQRHSPPTHDKPIAVTARSYYGPADSFTAYVSTPIKGLNNAKIKDLYRLHKQALDQLIKIITSE